MTPELLTTRINDLENNGELRSGKPDMPVGILIQEAENLYNWCEPDREFLVKTGLDWTLVEDIPLRAEVLTILESRWSTEHMEQKSDVENWKIAFKDAKIMYAELLRNFKFAYHDKPDILSRIKSITSDKSNAAIIEAFCDLSMIGKKNKEELEAAGMDMNLLDKAYKASFELAELLAKANMFRGGNSDGLVPRNKAYYFLKEAVDKVRKAGQFAFHAKPDRFKGYLSPFIQRKNQKSRLRVE